jgi:hypothetical protein
MKKGMARQENFVCRIGRGPPGQAANEGEEVVWMAMPCFCSVHPVDAYFAFISLHLRVNRFLELGMLKITNPKRLTELCVIIMSVRSSDLLMP